jgi:xylulokinase
MSTYLGIDVGTQSLKAVVYDAEQRAVIASASSPLALISRPDGTREQLAQWWLDALHRALHQIAPGQRAGVAAIGVSGQQHGLVPLDGRGQVLAPVKLWCDTSTTTECEEIAALFGGQQRCIEEVGNAILPGYTAPKIRWLRKHLPDAYAAMTTVLLPHDYLNFHLTGERFNECGDASGTGLLDIRSRQWHAGLLQAVDPERDLADCLPRLIAAGDTGGTLLGRVAAELGLPAGIPVACGGGDNMMSAIATGNLAPGRLTISLGTSGTMFAYTDSPCIDNSGELAAFCSSTGGWLPLLCTMNCTVATEQARDLLQMEVGLLDRVVEETPAGANGVVVLPFYNGERTPNLPAGKGCILGLDIDNMTPANIARASMEAAVFGLRLGLDAFRRNGCQLSDIRLTGGAAQSRVWRQMIADNLGLPVRLLAAPEGAALGAALNAMLLGSNAHGRAADLAAIVDEHIAFDDGATAEPDPASAAAYDGHYQRYYGYLEQLRPLFE